MSADSQRLAGILLVIYPTVVFGGVSLLTLLLKRSPYFVDSPMRRDMFRAGHAHAGVLLILSLVMLLLSDHARLPPAAMWLARTAAPVSAILVPAAFFLSVVKPGATRPSGLVRLAYAGAVILGLGMATLGIGLLRNL